MTPDPASTPAPRDPAAPLRGARVVVGVAGGVAAYKAAELVRLLDKAGAKVRVAMTPRAQRFVGAMTFQALTGQPVFTELFSLHEEATIGHIALADWADLLIVAPATAGALARLAAGAADDPVSTVVLATRAPVLLAPSMNVHMWANPLTQANVRRLVEVAGHRVVGPGDGFLACRWSGPGRLAEPADIVEAAAQVLSPQDLAGRRVLVTAGPTYEPIDPVRFLGNRSSGKMGVALAQAARRRGAEVTLVLGPSALPDPPGVATRRIETAAELAEAIAAARAGAGGDVDAIVMTAAVADYRARAVAPDKLKRGTLGAETSLALTANPDLLAGLGRARGAAARPVLVGFAAETRDVLASARGKLAAKRCDLIVANDVAEPGSGFAVDTNRVTLVDAAAVTEVPAGRKEVVAHRILDRLAALLAAADASLAPGALRSDAAPRRPRASAPAAPRRGAPRRGARAAAARPRR